MKTQRAWGIALGAAAALAALAAAGVGIAQERASDASPVWGAYTFGPTHAIMRDLRADLEAIQGSFLTGDIDTIESRADTIVAGMIRAEQAMPSDPVALQDPVWRMGREIVEQARRMQLAAHEGRYHDAYTSYVSVVNRCISCHQEQRMWGRFSGKPAAEMRPDEPRLP